MNERDVKEIVWRETSPISGIGCSILVLYAVLAIGAYFLGKELQSLKLRLDNVEAQQK